MPQYKSKEICPSKCLTMTLASELSHTDWTCLYLALHLIAQLRCKHLVLRPYAAPSQSTSWGHANRHNSCHGRVVYFLRYPSHLSGPAYPEKANNGMAGPYFYVIKLEQILSDNFFILGPQLLSDDSWSHMPISGQFHFSGNLTDNRSRIYTFLIITFTFHLSLIRIR